MDVGRLTIAAARKLRMRLWFVCLTCGHSDQRDPDAFHRHPQDMRLSALPLYCSSCLRRDFGIFEAPDGKEEAPDPKVFSFQVDAWNKEDSVIVEHIAACKHSSVARAMFKAATEAYPQMRLTLRQRALLIESYKPPGEV